MPPERSHDLADVRVDIGKMLIEMQFVREDVKELKDALKEELPSLRERIGALELENEKSKVRITTASSIAAALGAVFMFVVEKVFFK